MNLYATKEGMEDRKSIISNYLLGNIPTILTVKVPQINQSGHYNDFKKYIWAFCRNRKKSTNLEMLAKYTVIVLYQNHGQMYQM